MAQMIIASFLVGISHCWPALPGSFQRNPDMHGMLGEAISYVIGHELAGTRRIVIPVFVERGELTVSFRGTDYTNCMDPLVQVVTQINGDERLTAAWTLRLSEIAHFLSVIFDAEKAITFKQHDPFFVIEHDSNRAEGV
jgi:hypothetical protein